MTAKKTINVDYHFHPNLPRSEAKAQQKIGEIYRKFKEMRIDAVVITEHAFKDYARAFDMMEKNKPGGISIFPGLEYVTRENIDICLFSKDRSVYNHDFKPFGLSYDETIALIDKDPSLFGFVTHPFTLGTTSIVNKKGEAYAKKAINAIGAVEASYTVYSPLKKLLQKTGLSYVFPQVSSRIRMNENLPKRFYPTKVKFLATGSDAHHTWKIGSHAKVPLLGSDVFKSIVNNKELHTEEISQGQNPLFTLVNVFTAFLEFCMKMRAKLFRRN